MRHSRTHGRLMSAAIGLLLVVPIVGWPSFPAQAAVVRVTGIAVEQAAAELRVTIAVSGHAQYRLVAFRPDWIVMDVEQAALGIPAGLVPISQPAQNLVQRVRVGQYTPATVRVIVELRTARAFSVAASPGGSVIMVTIPLAAAAPAQAAQARVVLLPVPSAPPAPPAQIHAQLPPAPVAPSVPAAAAPVPPNGVIDIDLRDAEISDVLEAVAKMAAINIVTDPDVKGKITVRLKGVTLENALRLILEPSGLAYTTIGNTIVVGKPEHLAHPFLREYHLANIPASTFAATILPVTGIKKDAVSVDDATNTLFVLGTEQDQAAVQNILSRVDNPADRLVTRVIKLDYIDAAVFLDLLGAKMPDTVTKTAKVDKASNSIVLTATAAQMDIIDGLLPQTDNPLPQVLIESTVLEVPTDLTTNLGVAWQQSTTFTVTSTGTAPNGQLSWGVTAPGITAILNTLIQDSRSRLLANPRLAVRDGVTATMNIGDKIPFQIISPTGVPSLVIIDAGVQLEITPRVNRDGYVTIHMHPEVSAIATPPAPNVPPTISTREATTDLTVKDGASIIIAGLIQKNETSTTVKIPLLGDIPILGWLFKSRSTDNSSNEVIFIITPHIMQKVGS
jgi:type II secretory pathway component GspD/PulD (secretin)